MNVFEPSSVVRIAVTIYLVSGGFAAFLLWRNAAAPDALQHSGIIIAGLLPAFIAVLPYIRINEIERKFDLVVLFDESNKQVLPLNSSDTYSMAYMSMYSGLGNEELTSREISDEEVSKGSAKQYWTFFHKEKGLDLIERLVLMSLTRKFHLSWDIEYTKSRTTPIGSLNEGKFGKEKSREVNIYQVRTKFRHNHLIQDHWMDIIPPTFGIPESAEFHVDAVNNHRTINITHNSTTLSIDIFPSAAGELRGLWGKRLPEEMNLVSLQYRVVVTLKYKKYSPNGSVYERWFENTANAIEQYDWDYIDQYREKELMRQHLEAK